MPSTSPKQRRFMAAAAHNPTFAKKAGIAQSVAREFNDADRAQRPTDPPKPRRFVPDRGSPRGSAPVSAPPMVAKPRRPPPPKRKP